MNRIQKIRKPMYLLFTCIAVALFIYIIYDVLTYKEQLTTITDVCGNETTTYNPDNIYTTDTCNNLMNVNYFNDNMYYTPNNITTYTNSEYIPTYEDSVYLSRSSLVTFAKPIVNSTSMMGGFCSYTKSNPSKTEEICNKIDNEVCASTDCCLLLGGEKCVSGNEHGPTMTSNYNDPYIKNKDFYFFKGKCFGNC